MLKTYHLMRGRPLGQYPKEELLKMANDIEDTTQPADDADPTTREYGLSQLSSGIWQVTDGHNSEPLAPGSWKGPHQTSEAKGMLIGCLGYNSSLFKPHTWSMINTYKVHNQPM